MSTLPGEPRTRGAFDGVRRPNRSDVSVLPVRASVVLDAAPEPALAEQHATEPRPNEGRLERDRAAAWSRMRRQLAIWAILFYAGMAIVGAGLATLDVRTLVLGAVVSFIGVSAFIRGSHLLKRARQLAAVSVIAARPGLE